MICQSKMGWGYDLSVRDGGGVMICVKDGGVGL